MKRLVCYSSEMPERAVIMVEEDGVFHFNAPLCCKICIHHARVYVISRCDSSEIVDSVNREATWFGPSCKKDYEIFCPFRKSVLIEDVNDWLFEEDKVGV